jgi:hypothetical protein
MISAELKKHKSMCGFGSLMSQFGKAVLNNPSAIQNIKVTAG